MNDSKKYVGYEYKTVVVRREMEGLWTDSYKNMGSEHGSINRIKSFADAV